MTTEAPIDIRRSSLHFSDIYDIYDVYLPGKSGGLRGVLRQEDGEWRVVWQVAPGTNPGDAGRWVAGDDRRYPDAERAAEVAIGVGA